MKLTESLGPGVMNEAYRASGQKPWTRGAASLDDLLKLKRLMDLSFGRSREPGNDRELWFPRPVFAELRRIVRALETEDKVLVSDRKLVKLYKVIRTQAFLVHGGPVQHADLGLLAYVGDRRDELAVVASKVKALLGLTSG